MNFVSASAEIEYAGDRPYFRFDTEAQKIFFNWLEKLQNKIKNEENPLIAEHLSKYRSLMPSIALIIHLVDIAEGQSKGRIDVETAKKAVKWCAYLESHARRIYGLLGAKEKATIELVKKIKDGKLENPFSIRDIYRKDWYLLDTKEKAEEACTELEYLGWISKVSIPVPNRHPQIKYQINPEIKNRKNI